MQLALQSTPLAVRHALTGLFQDDRLGSLADTQRGTAELLLAEVLNNVVEHAYSNETGEIEVTIGLRARSLIFHVQDQGAELPCHILTTGQLRDHEPQGDLPEGGFGWHMIRAMAKDVKYRRQDGRNHLFFRLDLA